MTEATHFTVNSLRDMLNEIREHYADNTAFMFERGGKDYSLTYKNFHDYTMSVARALVRLEPSERRVALVGESSFEWIATYFATVISGGVIVPIDAGIDKGQFASFVKLAECNIVAYSGTWVQYIEGHTDDMPSVCRYISLFGDDFEMGEPKEMIPAQFMHLSELYRLGLTLETELPITDASVMSTLLFTSGTTGSSKGVMLSQTNICSVLNDAVIALKEVQPEDVLLSVLPLHHTYEMSCGIMAPLMFGASIAINDSIRHVSRNMKKYKPTIMTLVPLFVEQLYKNIMNNVRKQSKEKKLAVAIKASRASLKVGIDLRAKLFAEIRAALGGRIKYLVCGAAALNPVYARFFEDIGIRISQGYGITECAPLISVVPFNEYNPASCGKPTTGVQVYIDKARAQDSFGEIVVKGENVMLGYYKNEEATEEVMHRGWFYTGDLGYMDEDGFLYITGRKKNVIVLQGGKNVFPEEIEEYLADIDLIEECVVLGREDESGKVTIVAMVYPSETVTKAHGLEDREAIENEIRKQITEQNRKLVTYKQIGKVEFRYEPFEKTSTKKIKRFLLS